MEKGNTIAGKKNYKIRRNKGKIRRKNKSNWGK